MEPLTEKQITISSRHYILFDDLYITNNHAAALTALLYEVFREAV